MIRPRKVSSGSPNSRVKTLFVDFSDERGSVEAGLTLIPLTILFLLAIQLVFASQWGNWQRVTHQSATDVIAIHGKEKVTSSESRDLVRHEPLLGGGYLVISERREPIPFIANFGYLNPVLGDEKNAGAANPVFSYRRVVTALSEVFTR